MDCVNTSAGIKPSGSNFLEYFGRFNDFAEKMEKKSCNTRKKIFGL
jgi:hypothetical protein